MTREDIPPRSLAGEATTVQSPIFAPALEWFRSRNWIPFPFQIEAWAAYSEGRDGLVNAPTGMGKTYAVWMGPLMQWLAENPDAARVKWELAETEASKRARSAARAKTARARKPSRRIPKVSHSSHASHSSHSSAPPDPTPAPEPAPIMELRVSNKELEAAGGPAPPTVLWITPLRALANDTLQALRAPIADMGLPWSLELRTGDISASVRMRQKERLPTALITTPESLCVLLSYPETRAQLAKLRCVIVDEWHELLSSKRGTQTELALARLRRWCPTLQTWGLSATLGNLDQALHVLTGTRAATSNFSQPAAISQPTLSDCGGHAAAFTRCNSTRPTPALIRAPQTKITEIVTVLPEKIERFPWVGHIGTNLLPQVIADIESARTTLLFCNVRSGAEIWYTAMTDLRPDLAPDIEIHHGSLDREHRERVENRLRKGTVRCVVCTSSLDLGVDFPAVDQVIQVGSPKGVARLLQRAGRSGHQPGRASRVLCVPTHAFELVEYAAARGNPPAATAPTPPAVSAHSSHTSPTSHQPSPWAVQHPDFVEPRVPLDRPLDVLVQHMVTIGLGGGFDPLDFLDEVRSAYSYTSLSEEEFAWCLDFVMFGGPALRAYANFRRVEIAEDGHLHIVRSPTVAKFHRMAIGTIVADATISVRLERGPTLGTVEEGFLAAIPPGGRFVFAGRLLELVRLRDIVATVRLATAGSGFISRWMGAKFPMSATLAAMVRAKLDDARRGEFAGPEMSAVQPILEIQRRWSHIPAPDELLIEDIRDPRIHMIFVYPFEGRAVHEGLGALVAYRASRRQARSISVTVNDYGFQLISPEPLELDDAAWGEIFSPEHLTEDLLACLNTSELARRQFREVARVAGLIFSGFPGAPKTARQVQSSSGLLYDVFQRFDPNNLLLHQSRKEVLDRQLEVSRLRRCLERISGMRIHLVRPERLTPLAFPLWAAFTETEVSSESWSARVQRMAVELEEEAEQEQLPAEKRTRRDKPREPLAAEEKPQRSKKPRHPLKSYRKKG